MYRSSGSRKAGRGLPVMVFAFGAQGSARGGGWRQGGATSLGVAPPLPSGPGNRSGAVVRTLADQNTRSEANTRNTPSDISHQECTKGKTAKTAARTKVPATMSRCGPRRSITPPLSNPTPSPSSDPTDVAKPAAVSDRPCARVKKIRAM